MKIKSVILASALAAVSTAGFTVAPASAYTACNKEGDCWHTDTRVHFPGATLSFHNDKWGESHRDGRYHWHEADNEHDWHHGYWAGGEWHASR
jgi:hypothetical protein